MDNQRLNKYSECLTICLSTPSLFDHSILRCQTVKYVGSYYTTYYVTYWYNEARYLFNVSIRCSTYCTIGQNSAKKPKQWGCAGTLTNNFVVLKNLTNLVANIFMAKKKFKWEVNDELLNAFQGKCSQGKSSDNALSDIKSLEKLADSAMDRLSDAEKGEFLLMYTLASNGVTPEEYAQFYDIFQASAMLTEGFPSHSSGSRRVTNWNMSMISAMTG